MSILIKGVEMPKEKPIAMVMYPNGTVLINGECVEFAVEISKHGRLIDADELASAYENSHLSVVAKILADAPAVLEAEG